MLKIEILKTLKRKLNYIYFIILLLLSTFFTYKYQEISEYIGVGYDEYIYSYVLKNLLIFTSFALGINIIFSYREDYKCKVNSIIYNSKISNFKNLISKIFVNFFNFSFYYVILLSINVVYLHYIKVLNIIKLLNSSNFLINIGLAIVMLFFVANLVLLIISIFNNTNLAVALSLLFFLGTKYLVDYLEGINSMFNYLKYSLFDIYNIAVSQLFLEINSKIVLTTLTYLLINSFFMFILSIILKTIKKK